MLGGAQSIHTNSYDEVLCTPTEEAVKLAIRTQQIVQDETGVSEFPDPLGGSYLIERLTDEIEAEAEAEFDRIEQMGGMTAAAREGYPQRMIRAAASAYEEAVERGKIVAVGVNKYRADEAEEPLSVSAELETRRGYENTQLRRLKELKRTRNVSTVERALEEVRGAARSGANMMPSLIAAVETYATLGEVSRALQDVWGEHKEREIFGAPPRGVAMDDVVQKYRLTRPLRILIAKGGLDGHDRIIYTLAEFYRDLGAEVIYPGLHCSMREIAKRAMEEDVDVVGISTHIGSPIVFFERLAEHLRDVNKEATLIGGGVIRNRELEALESFGVKYFSPVGTPFEEIARFLFEEGRRRDNGA